MKANPGGNLDPEEVIGRDQLIAQIWSMLEKQSVILSAERRTGKTSIMNKMKAEGQGNQLIIYKDVENIKSPIEFVEAVWEDVEQYLSQSRKTTQNVKKFLNQFQDAEITGFKLPTIAATHWKTLLTKTIEDLVNNQDHQVIFLWDEIPYMLNNIGVQESMEILDTLRSLRQTYTKVRMVFTGSIGLHHVIEKLQQAGYGNEPMNDMYPIYVPPLSLKDAQELTTSLIEGENIDTDNIEVISEYISESVSCIPFYIHHLINELKWVDNVVDKTTVDQTLNDMLLNPSNPLEMEHYLKRIDIYSKSYTVEQKKYALKILDILSCEDGLSFDDLCNRLESDPNISMLDEEKVRSVLTLLRKDYYLVREGKIFKFYIDIIKKYWDISRNL